MSATQLRLAAPQTGYFNDARVQYGVKMLALDRATPNRFAVQPERFVPTIAAMERDLTNQLNMLPAAPLFEPQVDSLCAVPFELRWVRGVVESSGLFETLVQLLDWGESQFVPVGELQTLPTSFTKLPPMAYTCRVVDDTRDLILERVARWRQMLHAKTDRPITVRPLEGFRKDRTQLVQLNVTNCRRAYEVLPV